MPGRHAGHRLGRAAGLGVVLLAEDPVGDRAVLADRRDALGSERGQRGVGAVAHPGLREPEHLGQLLVAAALAEQQLQHGALVGGEGSERAHRQREGSAFI